MLKVATRSSSLPQYFRATAKITNTRTAHQRLLRMGVQPVYGIQGEIWSARRNNSASFRYHRRDVYSSELEERIIAARNNPEAYLIYADWLQSHGDPLGELIIIQHALRHHPAITGSPFPRIVDPPSGR